MTAQAPRTRLAQGAQDVREFVGHFHAAAIEHREKQPHLGTSGEKVTCRDLGSTATLDRLQSSE
ncbi:MAG: hypothetical protein ACREX3_13750 [Gammaproteobacteria bacterium]